MSRLSATSFDIDTYLRELKEVNLVRIFRCDNKTTNFTSESWVCFWTPRVQMLSSLNECEAGSVFLRSMLSEFLMITTHT